MMRLPVFISCLVAMGSVVSAQPVKTRKAETPPQAQSLAGVGHNSDAQDYPNLEHVLYRYNPSLTRDPFSSPTENSDKNRIESIDEIGVRGRVISNGLARAIVLDSRGKTRLLKVGHRFRDGEIVAITNKAVIFRQWDPTSVNRAHAKTVEKPFKREEGNR